MSKITDEILSEIIGKHVRYKNGSDKKEYIIVEYANSMDGNDEIAIIQNFRFYPHRTRQLKIWQSLNKFDILPDE
jgi:hypothetical protein